MSMRETAPWYRPLTVDDLERMPDDGNRYELVDGRLDVSPAPVYVHTLVEGRLAIHLGPALVRAGFMILQGLGMNLKGDRDHHRIPDLAVIRADAGEHPYLTRPPLLAVEVLSPECRDRDRFAKRAEYAEFGVPSYWIIDPSLEKPSILELRLDGGTYRAAARVFGDDVFRTDAPCRLSIVPRWLVSDGAWLDHIGGE
ncbi:Uma2 family endonuclease [Marinactinospora rubrisoli]|uniref:Uma2 family endonuclease n=1 Tax=Marinactinospora rubrisoli TaxID=2715399 RepID=A0ABW2K8Y9_9ACTN